MELINEDLEAQLKEKADAERVLVGVIESFMRESEDARRPHEDEWLRALQDVKGTYSPDQLAIISQLRERNPLASSVFIKTSTVKALAAYGNILEILTADGKFPISADATPIPEGIEDTVTISLGTENSEEEPADLLGFPGDGMEIPPGTTSNMLGGLKKQFNKLLSAGAIVKKGQASDPTELEIHPAKRSAEQLNKQFQDQFIEMDAESKITKTCWELAHLGSGCLKGPFTTIKKRDKWIENDKGELVYKPDSINIPDVSAPTIWNIYPDHSVARVSEGKGIVERHLMNKPKLRSLLKNKSFKKDKIEELVALDPSYVPKHWEENLTDSNRSDLYNRYEVLEYWGYIDSKLAKQLGLKFKETDEYQINAFICEGRLLKAVVNPFIPMRIPYNIAAYEDQHYQIWGKGIPHNNRDTQQLVNAHWRAAIDNLNLAGSVILEVDKNRLVPGQDLALYPGKHIFTKGGQGQAIRGITFNDTSFNHFTAVDKAMQFSDDATGIPRFYTGSGNLPSSIRTASQTSMLLGATAQNIKTVVKNIDRDILEPFGNALFQWNMQFNKDNPTIRGDISIKPRGTSSLLQREVKSQRLMTFAQLLGTNPAMAPQVDWEYLAREISKTMDLDPDKVINDPAKAKEMALLMQLTQGAQGNGQAAGTTPPGTPPAGQLEGNGGVPSGANPADLSGVGGGNIGTGNIPQSGESNFTG